MIKFKKVNCLIVIIMLMTIFAGFETVFGTSTITIQENESGVLSYDGSVDDN
ncbi:MAG: hypothetical protein H0Z29_10160, partial [Candidatus Marinimicrobia bacterium]|nr:hypothetical protein [Candidatus Neomarinimicrobiota bacterium]